MSSSPDISDLTLPMGKLLEGVVTTLDAESTPRIAPMGPIVNSDFSRLLLRPFQTSKTYANLKRTGVGVLNVTDDVELIARAAVGQLTTMPSLLPVPSIGGVMLADACRWYAFRIESLDDSTERTQIVARVVEHGTIRDFFGFNRAKHAVIEAAILATRLHLLDADPIRDELKRLAVIVDKTAGTQERRAFDFLQAHIENTMAGNPQASNTQGSP